MKILGIDPGYERLGIAVLESKENSHPTSPRLRGARKLKVLFSECFRTSAKDDHSKRLLEIHQEIERVFKKYKPEKVGIETLFFNKNIKTAIKVAEARGIILAFAEKHNCKIFEISPQQIKLAVTGYGKSDKKAVEKMIPLLVDMPASTNYGVVKKNSAQLDDELDAIAAALAIPARG